MADSTLITKIIEPTMIDWVAKQVGVPLKKRRYKFAATSQCRSVQFEVDGLADDNSVAAFACSTDSNKIGQVRKLFYDAAILLRIPAQLQIMVFLEDGQDVWKTFYNTCHGLIDLSPLKPMFCPLAAQLQIALAQFREEARTEVGSKGKKKSVPKLRR